MGEVAYELALPADLAFVQQVFHVSILRNCLGDAILTLPFEGSGLMKFCPMGRYLFRF